MQIKDLDWLEELSDEHTEPIQGGGWAADTLNNLVNWIKKDSEDGSAEGAAISTGKAVLTAPAVGGLALWTHVEHVFGGGH